MEDAFAPVSAKIVFHSDDQGPTSEIGKRRKQKLISAQNLGVPTDELPRTGSAKSTAALSSKPRRSSKKGSTVAS
jgi:hypothetical protein